MKNGYPHNLIKEVESDIPDNILNKRARGVLTYLFPNYDTEMNFSQYTNAINAIKSIASNEHKTKNDDN